MKKRLLSMMLAAALALTLGACGNSAEKADSGAASASAKSEAPAESAVSESAASSAAEAEEPAEAESAAESVAESTAESAAAETSFPEKQITLICPLSAGGGSDTISRLFAAALEEKLGVSVVVENKPGAGAGIGLEAIAASEPDGYTLGYIPAEVTTVEAMGNATVTPESFDYIVTAMKISALVCVPADSEFNTLEDLVEAAKANPGSITLGTAGVGNAYELGLRAMLKSAGIELNIVNFSDGTAEAITAMMGGNVQCCTAGTAEALPYVQSGEFKILCNLSAERSALFPDVETATELGYACNGGSWGAFGVPAGTPEEVLQVLRNAGEEIMNSDDFKNTLAEKGFDEYHIAGEEFKAAAMEMYGTNSGIIKEFELSAN